ncbi:cobalamin biosynthesis protein [Phyllobacterium endophyticum]|uniref:cobalamin biosynthesis protein n=1 Tax=Phyllobacterium endophyticum TaxID=1149773 RepID=UPI0011CCACBE|nr:cobalamin biosynthesis protein [Phyllobacterium endophyticum]TXR51010.1 cobalamin biosynthesis protein [Phyllobacterium endophyticum]
MAQPVYALGLGCERGCEPLELLKLATKVLTDAGIAASDLTGIYSIDQRRHEPAMIAVSEKLALPLVCYSAAVLEKQTPRLLNPSKAVFALVGCHGVAEAAALSAAGLRGSLVAGKTKSAHATAALAITKR